MNVILIATSKADAERERDQIEHAGYNIVAVLKPGAAIPTDVSAETVISTGAATEHASWSKTHQAAVEHITKGR